jgi:MFS family permease
MQTKYVVLAIFCFGQLAAGLVWYNYSAVLPVLLNEWSLTGAQAGMILSVFQAGYVAAVLASGFFSDRIGGRKVFVISAVETSLAGVAFALFAKDYLSSLIIRGLAGLGQGGLYVPGMRLLSQWFSPRERGKALGIYTCALIASYAGALYVVAPIASAHGWRLAILLSSVWGILGAAAVLFLVKDKPVVESDGANSETALSPGPISLIKAALVNKPLGLVNLGYMSHMWELYGFYGWIGPFLVAAALLHGFQSDSALVYGNTIAATAMLMGAVSPALGGFISDKIGRTKTVSIVLFISAACSLSTGWLVNLSFYVLLIAVLIYGFFVVMESAVFKAGLSEMVEPTHLGTALGVQSFLGFGITIVSPAMFGLLLDIANPQTPAGAQFRVWGWSFALLAVGALVGPVAMYFLRKCPESLKMAGGKQ